MNSIRHSNQNVASLSRINSSESLGEGYMMDVYSPSFPNFTNKSLNLTPPSAIARAAGVNGNGNGYDSADCNPNDTDKIDKRSLNPNIDRNKSYYGPKQKPQVRQLYLDQHHDTITKAALSHILSSLCVSTMLSFPIPSPILSIMLKKSLLIVYIFSLACYRPSPKTRAPASQARFHLRLWRRSHL